MSSRLVIAPETLAGCTSHPPTSSTECRGYGDVIVTGNRMYVALWTDAAPETQIFDLCDINSQLRLSRQTIQSSGFAFQLGRDGNGQIYAVASNNGRIFLVSNDQIQWNGGTAYQQIAGNPGVRDASECPIAAMDFGDAPRSYGTEAGPRAARHTLTNTLRLGTVPTQTVIRDLRGFPSTNADGDDTKNYNGGSSGGTDDEDSVSNIPRLSVDSTSYAITNVVVYNNTGSQATLYGWVDFDRDGEFEQSERVTMAVPSSGSTQYITLTWSSPSGLVYGQSYVRLRLSTSTVTTSTWGTGNDGAFLATGYAPNGETEDYPVPIDNRPTAVTLLSFSARSEMSGLGSGLIPISLFAGITLVSAGGLIAYRRSRTRRSP